MWNGGEIGTGSYVDDDFQLGQEVRVSKLTQKEIGTSGGFFTFNDVKVTGITPAFPGGGYTLQQVAPATQFAPAVLQKTGYADALGYSDQPPDPAVEYIYVLSGEINGLHRLKNCNDDHALHYTLYLEEIEVHASANAR